MLESKLATRLIKIVMGFYFLVALSTTMIQLGLEFNREKERLLEEIRTTLQLFQPILGEALWNFDYNQLEITLESLINTNLLESAEVLGHKGERQIAVRRAGVDEQGAPVLKQLENDEKITVDARAYELTFDLVSTTGNQKVGTIQVHSDAGIVIERAAYNFIVTIVNAVIKTLSLWMIAMLVLRKYLTRPLMQLTHEIDHLNVTDQSEERSEPPQWDEATINQPNELGVLIKSFLRMEAELRQKTREVLTLNSSLESLVEERTQELQDSLRQLSETVHELQAMQTKLVEQEKMASLGVLVAGVAHEINTPIGVAVTASSHLDQTTDQLFHRFMSGQLTKGDFKSAIGDIRETTEMILKNLERAAQQVKSFKMVAVDQSSEDKRRFNLREYLDSIVLSLRPQLKRTSVQVHLDVPDNIELESFPGAYSQIFTNLIMNSITHGFGEQEAGEIVISAQAVGNRLQIDYYDNGKGIPAQIRDRIFDPFVTTNRHGGGSGLGTHILYNLVTQVLKGTVTCCDAARGVHFSISLPQ